ncbi:MAG: site-2 protease family protein [Candidatus Syntrophonatronum acetioxidans]|uniref:Site-2 protease family protein n=1 Tax=Candidatus Syntrophonatronum acetioxidans TaxID=1795816 RepID=A0A424YFK1_9FIRM|nr:MAG: site-2 protease family protein [Candidatus Syntrophonatronum acetioxidans]
MMELGNYLIRIPALLIALTFHEFAHGYAANQLGDPTARFQGRLTLNPLVHLDPIGLLMLWFAGFGWAKPVPVNPLNFRGDKKQGMVLVAAAGPGINLVLAFVALILQGFIFVFFYNDVLLSLVGTLVTYNILLAIFNLIPIPPLDGSKILAGLLPFRYDYYFRQLEQYGPFLLILLVFTGAFGLIIWPLASYIYFFMATIANIFLGIFI